MQFPIGEGDREDEEPLDLSEFVIGAQDIPPIYDLFAISNKMGALADEGHYTAYGKNWRDGKWYKFDDSTVSPMANLQDMISTGSYVLLYKKRGASGKAGDASD